MERTAEHQALFDKHVQPHIDELAAETRALFTAQWTKQHRDIAEATYAGQQSLIKGAHAFFKDARGISVEDVEHHIKLAVKMCLGVAEEHLPPVEPKQRVTDIYFDLINS